MKNGVSCHDYCLHSFFLFLLKECEIPDEFKLTNVDPIDVMAYLQIRRAEPLRVEHRQQSLDWE